MKRSSPKAPRDEPPESGMQVPDGIDDLADALPSSIPPALFDAAASTSESPAPASARATTTVSGARVLAANPAPPRSAKNPKPPSIRKLRAASPTSSGTMAVPTPASTPKLPVVKPSSSGAITVPAPPSASGAMASAPPGAAPLPSSFPQSAPILVMALAPESQGERETEAFPTSKDGGGGPPAPKVTGSLQCQADLTARPEGATETSDAPIPDPSLLELPSSKRPFGRSIAIAIAVAIVSAITCGGTIARRALMHSAPATASFEAPAVTPNDEPAHGTASENPPEAASVEPAAASVEQPEPAAPLDVAAASATRGPAAAAPAVVPEPTVAKTALEGTGALTTAGAPHGWRIFVDGRTVGQTPASVTVPCGVHTVQLGSAGTPQTVEVPCGGEIDVGAR